MTRPLDLHIGNIASAKVPPGESYPGFHGPYAARVRQIDACFGELVDTLKRLHLYDNSIIVLTSDHGDSLGEGQRWGHGFTAFPEVLRIPLIIHLPPALRRTDVGRPGPRELFDRYHTDVVRAAWRVHPRLTGRAAHATS